LLNGQAKNYIWRVLLLAAVLIETIRFVYQLLVENMSTPTKTLYQKKVKVPSTAESLMRKLWTDRSPIAPSRI
jgi:hypothetical protein